MEKHNIRRTSISLGRPTSIFKKNINTILLENVTIKISQEKPRRTQSACRP